MVLPNRPCRVFRRIRRASRCCFMTRESSRKCHAAAIVLVGFILGGCTSSSGQRSATSQSTTISKAPGAPDHPTATRSGTVDSVSLPLDAFREEYTSTRASIFDAEQILMSKCMADLGFTFPATQYQQSDLYYGVYGLTDPSRASQLGYTHPEQDSEPDLIAVETAKFPHDPAKREAFSRALNGVESSETSIDVSDPQLAGAPAAITFPAGCVGEADKALFGSSTTYARYQSLSAWAQVTVEASLEEALAKGDGKIAEDDWSSCMAAAGYKFSTVLDPLSFEWPEPRPGPEELSAARSDLECKSATNYVARVRASERKIEVGLIEAAGDSLKEFETLRRNVLNSTQKVT